MQPPCSAIRWHFQFSTNFYIISKVKSLLPVFTIGGFYCMTEIFNFFMQI